MELSDDNVMAIRQMLAGGTPVFWLDHAGKETKMRRVKGFKLDHDDEPGYSMTLDDGSYCALHLGGVLLSDIFIPQQVDRVLDLEADNRGLEQELREANELAKTLKAELDGLIPRFVAATERALAWTDQDKPLEEDRQIRQASPTITGDHQSYATALRLVGACRSKGKLVALVNWLIVRRAEEVK